MAILHFRHNRRLSEKLPIPISHETVRKPAIQEAVFGQPTGGKYMKILIISDTHGNLSNFYKVLDIEKPIDNLFHLGDYLINDDEIREAAGCACAFVRGNCDWASREPEFRDFGLLGHNVHMEHGHMLPDGYNAIASRAVSLGADIMLSGHTHSPVCILHNGVYIVNPGSLSKPRQADRRPSYVILNIDSEGKLDFNIKYLE